MPPDPPTTRNPRSALRVSACPYPFESRRQEYVVPAGLSIAGIVELIQPDPLLRAHGIALIGEHVVPRANWHRVRPKPGTLVSLRLLPGGGGAARIAAMVAIAVVAVVTTVVTAGALAPVWGTLAAGLAGSLAGAAVSIGGSLLVNTLLPAPVPEMSRDYGTTKPTYAISGARNQAQPWGKLPFLLGRFKLTPPYAGLPYREQVGGEMYWRAMFAISHGPIAIEEIRIGQTLLANFTGVETEFRRGYWALNDRGPWAPSSGAFPSAPAFGDTWTASDDGTVGGVAWKLGETITFNGLADPEEAAAWDADQGRGFSLFPSDVWEDQLSAAITNAQPSAVRASQPGADEIGVDLVFERGLYQLQNSPPGKLKEQNCGIRIEQSPAGADDWTTVLATELTGKQTTPLYWGHRWRTADFGAPDPDRQYDVRVGMFGYGFDEQRWFGNFTWYALRTFGSGSAGELLPIPGVAMFAVRILASGQLSGNLDEFNLVAQSIARDWDETTGEWVWRPTSQPPALCRHVLQHPTRERPATDAQIDLERLAYWDGLTRANAREFNGVIESKGSLWSALGKIAQIGRAVPSLRDLKFSVVIDEPKTAPIRLFSPRNS